MRSLPACLQTVPACRHVLCVTVSQFITISLSLIVGKPIGPCVSAMPVQVLCLEQASCVPAERWLRKMQGVRCGTGALARLEGGMSPCIERVLRHKTGLLYGASHAQGCRGGREGMRTWMAWERLQPIWQFARVNVPSIVENNTGRTCRTFPLSMLLKRMFRQGVSPVAAACSTS